MKLVTGLLAPFQLDLARIALTAAGAQGLTVAPANTTGSATRGVYRGTELAGRPEPRVRVEVVVEDWDVTAAVKALAVAARSGGRAACAPEVGPVWVSPLHSVVRVRTGEAGSAAL